MFWWNNYYKITAQTPTEVMLCHFKIKLLLLITVYYINCPLTYMTKLSKLCFIVKKAKFHRNDTKGMTRWNWPRCEWHRLGPLKVSILWHGSGRTVLAENFYKLMMTMTGYISLLSRNLLLVSLNIRREFTESKKKQKTKYFIL